MGPNSRIRAVTSTDAAADGLDSNTELGCNGSQANSASLVGSAETFPDFLGEYMKRKLGSDWGNAEIVKPLAERHPLMQ
jgi:hypothetical protein